MIYDEQFQRFAELHKEIKRLETDVKVMKKKRDKLGEQILEIFTQLGTTTTKANGVTISVKTTTHASIRAGLDSQAVEMLDNLGYGDICKTTALPSKVAALVRELKKTNMVPEEFHTYLNIYDKTQVVGRES